MLYGRLEAVMDIEVDINGFRSLVKFFNPKSKTFTFKNLDLTPTLEEFHYLLSPTWNVDDVKVHVPILDQTNTNALTSNLQKYFGIDHEWMKGAIEGRTGYSMIHWIWIHQEMAKNPPRKKGAQVNFLALGIFGLVLFPHTQRSC